MRQRRIRSLAERPPCATLLGERERKGRVSAFVARARRVRWWGDRRRGKRAEELLSSDGDKGARSAMPPHTTGLLPSQEIRALIGAREIRAVQEIHEDQIQPASLDLQLASEAWRVRSSFLPGPGASVEGRLAAFGMHRIDLKQPAVLEKGCVYVVPLVESLALRSRTSGIANPKSSIGRLDVFTRLITDYSAVFDQVAPGYKGPMFAEISPRTFSVVVREGTSVSQLRLRRGSPPVTDTAIRRLHETVRTRRRRERAGGHPRGHRRHCRLASGRRKAGRLASEAAYRLDRPRQHRPLRSS